MRRKHVRLSKHDYIKQRLTNNPKLNPKYLAACYSKIRYTKEEREKALNGRPDFIKFYKCSFCEWYHIGRSKRT